MKFGSWTAALSAGVLCFASVGTSGAANVSVNINQRAQSIEGFGTALAWFRDNPFGSPRSSYNTQAFEDLYFDDLGASMSRMELQYTVLNDTGTIDPTNEQMSTPIFLGSNTYSNIAQFNFDALGVGHLKQFFSDAPAASDDDFELTGTLWSPPHWMKGPEVGWLDGVVLNEGKPTWGETANSQGGSLIDTPANLEQFGRYVTAWVKGWEQETGVAFDALSLQNEPAFSVFYNSAVYDPVLYIKALKAVRDAFDAHNTANPNDLILTRLHGMEDVGVGSNGDLGILWRQFEFIDAIRADSEAYDAIDVWSTHGYDSNGINLDDPSQNGGQNWELWNDGRSTSDPGTQWAQWEGVGNDTRPTWQTERSGEDQVWLSPDRANQNGGLALGVHIHDALVHGNVEAYLYWQAKLDDSDIGHSLTQDDDPDQPKFAAFRHFSKHVRPGAERVDVQTDDAQLLASAYLHEDDQTLTYVLLNLDDASDTAVLNLPTGLDFSSVQAWQSTDGNYYQNLALGLQGGNAFSVFLPRESMLTLVFSWAASGLIGDYNGSGQIEQGDLDLVLQNWGGFGTPAGWVNDLPQGQIDQAELDTLLQNWGSTASPDFGNAVVPEPVVLSSLMFILMAGGVGARRVAYD